MKLLSETHKLVKVLLLKMKDFIEKTAFNF